MASKAKHALIHAFLELINEEEFSRITVTALVEKCGISRQTFYYHFNDIDEMLAWAFKDETKRICDAQTEGKWHDSAALYVDFLNRYDKLLRSASQSTECITVYNLLFESFYSYINAYLATKNKGNMNQKDFRFLISCMAASFAGMVMKEIQKEESSYDELLGRITNGFRLFPNN